MKTYGSYPPQEHIPIMSMSTIDKTADLIILASDQQVVNSGDILKIINLAHTQVWLCEILHLCFVIWNNPTDGLQSY